MPEHEDLLIAGARVVTGGASEEGWVRFTGGLVAARGTGAPPPHEGRRIDAVGRVLVPGFVDLHVHGGGRGDASDGPSGVPPMLAAHRAHGTTRSMLSLVSGPVPALAENLRALAPLVRADPLLLGTHLEGPFLSPENRGAHDPAALVAPTPEAVDALLDAADGTLAQVTMAPELPGAEDAAARFIDAGVRVAVGHTVADLATAGAAFDAGASLLTHAFNAMPGLHHRAPGPIGAAVARPGVVLELVADGLHVHPIVIASLFRMTPGRIALVTDAMAAAGVGDGLYRLGSLEVEVRDGAARLASGSLAGSTLTLDAAIRTVVAAGIPLEEAVLAATGTPARAIGRPELGALEVGAPADAVLLSADLEVEHVWAAGVPLR
ncbi:N-acetylglucosamine-6-phosphate deacetylase [Amnibacterium kyonggiense]|uniref:N-acetylglucosamine 6-phosphate deacetylase n=1 Tax=Amnibacterium kyonggiense TaxID=595671 RepID=A0A4R7FL92_9MICO|nr:N-acetylglucosamine-6-phosphate deacetylase [Amnibacterium kyonggiense]TDS77172.1 N-acetylglucosamine 6-phosphate deacetylase [Amnibacterium kyonggiense]